MFRLAYFKKIILKNSFYFFTHDLLEVNMFRLAHLSILQYIKNGILDIPYKFTYTSFSLFCLKTMNYLEDSNIFINFTIYKKNILCHNTIEKTKNILNMYFIKVTKKKMKT